MNNYFASHSDLCTELYELLTCAPAGLSEYQLIQQLKAGGRMNLPDLPLSDPLGLFRTHFVLFNALYRLRDQLWVDRTATLNISPLCVQLIAYEPGINALSENDPLRAYYLDLAHLENTGSDEVTRLLSSFWLKLHGNQDVQAALELFGLSATDQTLDFTVIKHRYRQLVSLHHPDRGGCTAQLQAINKAMDILQRRYS